VIKPDEWTTLVQGRDRHFVGGATEGGRPDGSERQLDGFHHCRKSSG
jgi:hypothetical protein